MEHMELNNMPVVDSLKSLALPIWWLVHQSAVLAASFFHVFFPTTLNWKNEINKHMLLKLLFSIRYSNSMCLKVQCPPWRKSTYNTKEYKRWFKRVLRLDHLVSVWKYVSKWVHLPQIKVNNKTFVLPPPRFFGNIHNIYIYMGQHR